MEASEWTSSRLDQQAAVLQMASEHSRFLHYLMRRAVDWTDADNPWLEDVPPAESAERRGSETSASRPWMGAAAHPPPQLPLASDFSTPCVTSWSPSRGCCIIDGELFDFRRG